MKKRLLSGVLIAAATALIGTRTPAAAEGADRLWTIMVHFSYADGTSYDIPLRTGVPMSAVTPMLQDCGRSHQTGSVVRYHCYPVPE